MEPKFQTSFIPKKPIVSGISTSSFSAPPSVNLLSILSTTLLFITLIVSGGMFAYRSLLVSQVAQADKDLVASKAAFQPETVQELIDVSSRISSTEQLLKNHVTTSAILDLLNALTLKKMRFTTFAYVNKGNNPNITLSGETPTYALLAGQMDVFSKNPLLKNQNYSNFDLSDTGSVTFKFAADVDPALISYKANLDAINAAPSINSGGTSGATSQTTQ